MRSPGDLTDVELQLLKPGDAVAWRDGGYGGGYQLGTVERLTATLFVVRASYGREVRFRRDGGARVGNSFVRLMNPQCEDVLDWHARSALEEFARETEKLAMPRNYADRAKTRADVLKALGEIEQKLITIRESIEEGTQA